MLCDPIDLIWTERTPFEAMTGRTALLEGLLADVYRDFPQLQGKWAGHVARMEESRSAFKSLAGKPTGKKTLGRPRRRWEDNIKIGRAHV